MPGGGEFDLCLGGLGKIEPEVPGLKRFFFSGAEVANSFKPGFHDDLQQSATRSLAVCVDLIADDRKYRTQMFPFKS